MEQASILAIKAIESLENRKLKDDEKQLTSPQYSKFFSKYYALQKQTNILVSDYFSLFNIELWQLISGDFKKFMEIPIDKGVLEKKITIVPLLYSADDNKTQGKVHDLEEKYSFLMSQINIEGSETFFEAVAEYRSFILKHDSEKYKNFQKWYLENEILDNLDRELIKKYGPNDEDLISIVGYQIYKDKI